MPWPVKARQCGRESPGRSPVLGALLAGRSCAAFFQAGPKMAGLDFYDSGPWHRPVPGRICKRLLLRNEFKSHSRLKVAKRKKALNFFKAFCHLAEQAGFEPAVGY